jgi:hypothetical protein
LKEYANYFVDGNENNVFKLLIQLEPTSHSRGSAMMYAGPVLGTGTTRYYQYDPVVILQDYYNGGVPK